LLKSVKINLNRMITPKAGVKQPPAYPLIMSGLLPEQSVKINVKK